MGEVGERLLFVVLVDREVLLDEVVDEPSLGILNGDGQGDGPDDILVGDLVLDHFLGERQPGRPENGQTGEDDRNQDPVFHDYREGLGSKIPRPPRRIKERAAGSRSMHQEFCRWGSGP